MSAFSTYGRAAVVGLATAVVAACGTDVPTPETTAGHSGSRAGAALPLTGQGPIGSSDGDADAAVTTSTTSSTSPALVPYGGLSSDLFSPGSLGSVLPGLGGNIGGPFPQGFPGTAPDLGTTKKNGCPTRQIPGWLGQENKLVGTSDWLDARHTKGGSVNGYLNQVSAACGDTLTAYLTSPVVVPDATVTAYRMGYYGGSGGREVWRSGPLTLSPQAAPTVTDGTLMVEADWRPTLQIPVTRSWTPGYYLLVVRAPGQTASSMPLVVRADGDYAPLAYQASVLTYQAYNTYGGFSAYAKTLRDGRAARVLSFDRPYDDGGYYSPYQYELPLIREIEKLGVDTDYLTDLDVDAAPQELLAHKALITGGHSEYWTKGMYDAAENARDAGVNLAFFGANAVYTAVRPEPDASGSPRRHVAVYRSVSGDPVASADPSLATVNWADSPLNRPQAALTGQGYGYVGASGGLRILHPGSWIFAGTGVAAGQVVPNTVGGEYDQVDPNRPTTPKELDVLAAMPIRFKNGQAGMASTTYYVATSQAGVFDAGTTYWPCAMTGECLHMHDSPASRAILAQVTDNILTAFAAGPAGLDHLSTPHLPPSPEGLIASAVTPADVAQRLY